MTTHDVHNALTELGTVHNETRNQLARYWGQYLLMYRLGMYHKREGNIPRSRHYSKQARAKLRAYYAELKHVREVFETV